jgi:superfamily II DNA helicase RecQ
VLRLFRRPSAAEREIAQAIADELRAVDYKASGTLQRNLDLVGRMSRNEFDDLLDAMVRAGLIEIEEAEFEKDGEVIRFRKVRLTQAGLEQRATAAVELLISDGVVEEFGGRAAAPAKKTKAAAKSGTGQIGPAKAVGAKAAEAEPVRLTAQGEALAARLREWRAAEAKRLRVPAYVVLHDRTLTAIAQARPANPKQLQEIGGMGPAKAERFGEAILEICGAPE